MRESRRMQAVQSPVIPVVGELIRQTPGTISLGQGVVGYGPPPEAADQVRQFFADEENHKYKAVQGIPPLLEVIEEKLARENQIHVGSDHVLVVTAGGNMAFNNAVLAITDPGDEIMLQTPYYFNHEMAVTIAGCRPVLVPTDENYQLQPEAIREAVTERTRAVVTISPNNPTGAVYPEATLRAVNEICRDRGIYHIHDEAYEYFTYDGVRHFSPGSIPDSAGHTISLYSLSKAYGFASWRIGYMVVPGSLLASIKKIQDTLLICPPVVSQYAALGAYRAGRTWCDERIQAMSQVRDRVLKDLDGLGKLGRVPRADGAFYFLLGLETDWSADALVEELIRKYRVAAIPGTAFGMTTGCTLRIAYGALKSDTAAEGIGRLIQGLRGILKM